MTTTNEGPTLNAEVTAKLAALAAKAGVETLETRKMDSLDFPMVAVWEIKAMLEAAYRMGRDDSKAHKAPKEGRRATCRKDGR